MHYLSSCSSTTAKHAEYFYMQARHHWQVSCLAMMMHRLQRPLPCLAGSVHQSLNVLSVAFGSCAALQGMHVMLSHLMDRRQARSLYREMLAACEEVSALVSCASCCSLRAAAAEHAIRVKACITEPCQEQQHVEASKHRHALVSGSAVSPAISTSLPSCFRTPQLGLDVPHYLTWHNTIPLHSELSGCMSTAAELSTAGAASEQSFWALVACCML